MFVAVAVLPLLCDPGSPLAQVTWSPWSPCTHSCEAGLQSRRLTACSDTGDMCQVRYRRVQECAGYSRWRYQIQRVDIRVNRFSQRLSSLCCFIVHFLGQNSSNIGGIKVDVRCRCRECGVYGGWWEVR